MNTEIVADVIDGTDIVASVTSSDSISATVVTGGVGPIGPTGATGPTGAAGPGVATGGSTNQLLKKNSGTNYDTEWSSATIDDAGGISTTIANSGNTAGITVTQNDTTDNPRGILVTNTGTGNSVKISDSATKSSSSSGGGALLVDMTNSTNAGIVANFRTKNIATNQNLVRANSYATYTTTVNGSQTISTSSTQLTVTSTSSFPTSGTVRISNSTSTTESARGGMIHYTSIDSTHFIGTAGVFFKDTTSISVIDLAQVDYIDSTATASIVESLDSNSNGGMANIKITGVNPDMEFISKSGYDSSIGEGKFEIDVPTGDNVARTSTDVIRINGRADSNDHFDTNTIFTRPGATRQGMVGIGFQNLTSPTTVAAHLHIKNDTNFGDTNAPSLIGQIIQGASGQTANLLEFRANGSTTPLASVDASGNLSVPTATVANGGTGKAIQITQTGNTSNSTSTGGAVNLNNTGNTGAGLVVYSNQASPTGHLIVARADNASFNQSAIYATSAGASHTGNFFYTGIDSASAALSANSSNKAFTAFQVSGVETGHGTIKASNTYNGVDDNANAAVLSLDRLGTGTKAQGIFIDSTASGGSTGDLLNFQNNAVRKYRMDKDGNQIMYGSTSGSVTLSVPAVAGSNALTIPASTGTIAVTGDIPTTYTSVPAQSSTTAATAGASSQWAKGDHAHPRYDFQPSDHGLISWAFDPALTNGTNTALSNAGVLNLIKLHIPTLTSVTNIVVELVTNGSGLTSGQCFAALYQAGSLIGQTADQSTAWGSGASKLVTMALSGGPYSVPAGDVYVALWYNGTTGPAFFRAGGTTSMINANITATTSRFGLSNSSITTTAPGSLGVVSAGSLAMWAGLS